jgi:hypothetical protein
VRRILLMMVAAGALAACGSVDCECAVPATQLAFVGQVRSVEWGTCTGGDNDRVLYAVERWTQQSPSVGNPAEIVIQYECSAHYLDVGSVYAVGAGAFDDRAWLSQVGVEDCPCAPATTTVAGDDVPTGLMASLSATVTWWMVALGAVAGVAVTLWRRWVWRWRHLTSDGIRAAVLSTMTMVGAGAAATGAAALVWHDRSRVGVEWALWVLIATGAGVVALSFARRPKPASTD